MSDTGTLPTGIGTAAESPAGPVSDEVAATRPRPPGSTAPRLLQTVRIMVRGGAYASANRRRFGDVFTIRTSFVGDMAVTCHPDHARSLFTASSDLAPSLTGESQLRPVVGTTSVLTALGERHLRQRKLLLPSFHGDAIERYVTMIEQITERTLARWPVGTGFALAPHMQSITLDVILSGVFGIDGRPARSSPEGRLRMAIAGVVRASTLPGAKVAELMNMASERPIGAVKAVLAMVDAAIYPVIAARRRDPELQSRNDIMSLLLQAETEDGERLTDLELRNELLTLLLAGHETTANQLAWTWERLLRNPAAYERLKEAVRGSDEARAAEVVEQTIWEGMRNRPVIPAVGRRVTVPWQLGDYAIPAGTAVGISILLLHHREDLYPDPFAFRPERWEGVAKPGTYTWIPFGGGIRRCLGATLAMAEQRVVLTAMARQLELAAEDPRHETAVHRNVTMIPRHGARAVLMARR